MPTWTPKQTDISRAWHVVDADGLVLGRLATEVATLLRGKHKPTFTPNTDMGDHVIVINASKIVLTANKAETELIHWHTGYPGGIRERTVGDLLEKRPEEVIRRAVKGMLPKSRLGKQMITKLKVYAGAEHPHEAQQPTPYEIDHARRAS